MANQLVNNQTGRYDEKPRMGVITSYNRFKNTATVMISGRDSDSIDEILRNVTCPVYMGIQIASPEPGRMCWVSFKNGSLTQPIITHYFNHSYGNFEFKRQTTARYDLPGYLMGM